MPQPKQSFSYYLKLLYPFVKKDMGLLCLDFLPCWSPRASGYYISDSGSDHRPQHPEKDMGQMYRYGLYFVAVVLLSGLLSYLQIVLLSRLGIKIITKFKGDVFRHLLKLPFPGLTNSQWVS
jgi:ABC-type multidrug transport system fused ATPase/permease subunit